MSLQDFKVLTFDVVGTQIYFERGMLDCLHRTVPDAVEASASANATAWA